ncbi:MAG TPA: FAD-dependent oxidoreductase [Actinomycetales bacterium]|nr:FAD-dependent oxidoreductase [Actinomycetales bacterium]
MRIGIVGAGIAGLATAIGLRRAGAETVVLAREPAPAVSGSGLSIFANGLRALQWLGLGDAFTAASLAQQGLQAGQRRPDGAWLARTPPEAVAQLRVVERATLHELLLDALGEDAVRWSGAVTEVRGTDAGVQVGCADGTRLDVDLLVGADGIRSTIRSGWPGDPGVRYAGYAAWRGITSRPVDLQGAAGETWGRGERFGMAPLPDGRVYWFGVASLPARAPLTDEYAEVRRRFGDWHEPIGEILEASPAQAVFRRDIEELASPLVSYVHGRQVLVGDAAHAMTPDLGQGANQALEDAVTLALLISESAAANDPMTGDLTGLLSRYDRARRPRTQLIARRARGVGRMGQMAHPVGATVRDAVLPLVPSKIWRSALEQVQSWAPPVPAGGDGKRRSDDDQGDLGPCPPH